MGKTKLINWIEEAIAKGDNPVIRGGKGGDTGAQQKLAQKQFELQQQQIALENKRLAEQKRLQTEEEFRKRLFGFNSLLKKRQGMLSTISNTGMQGDENVSIKSLYGS